MSSFFFSFSAASCLQVSANWPLMLVREALVCTAFRSFLYRFPRAELGLRGLLFLPAAPEAGLIGILPCWMRLAFLPVLSLPIIGDARFSSGSIASFKVVNGFMFPSFFSNFVTSFPASFASPPAVFAEMKLFCTASRSFLSRFPRAELGSWGSPVSLTPASWLRQALLPVFLLPGEAIYHTTENNQF